MIINIKTKDVFIPFQTEVFEDKSLRRVYMLMSNDVIDLKKQENSDWWNGITAKEKESIEYGLKDAEEKKLKSHSNARNLYAKWL
jgi:hypothetical protein